MEADYESRCDSIQIVLERSGRLSGGSEVVASGSVIVSYCEGRPAVIDVIGARNGFEKSLGLAPCETSWTQRR